MGLIKSSPPVEQPGRSTSDPALLIEGVSKTYASGFKALEDINLQIRPGEIFALLGPNGAGKTTLINIVCGIVTPSAGTVLVGRPRHRQRNYRAARSQIGLVPQELTHRRVRDGAGHRQLQPRPVRQAAQSRPYRADPARSLAVGQAQQPSHDALGRHEAPRHDRQGPVARAAGSCFSTSRRRASTSSCGATCGTWCATSATAGVTDHPHDPLHRRSRRDGRPRRRDQPRRDHPGRGQGRADAQARQEAADPAAADADERRHAGGLDALAPPAPRGRARADLHLRHASRANRHRRPAAGVRAAGHRAVRTCRRARARSRTFS